MALILLSWLYVFVTASSLGISFAKLLGIPARNITVTITLGLFAVTLLASIWAIFAPIDLGFTVFLSTITLISGYCFRFDWIAMWKTTVKSIRFFSFTLKILFSLSSILILAQSATTPFIIDNETYYIQTIKWLNEYGFVPGLANLHLFFGQTSGWHIAQSVYSLSFVYDDFNDLNGFLLLIINFWSFQRLHSYLGSQRKMDLVFGLLPLSYLFLFQFVNAPSPDLAVYAIAFLVFSIYTDISENIAQKFKLISVLLIFAVYIKITALVLLLLPIIILLKYRNQIKNQVLSISLLGDLVLLLFVVKNIILTGYPLFPMTFLPYSDIDYIVPKEIMAYFFSPDMMHSFYMPFGSLSQTTFANVVRHYFWLSGIDSIIGCTTVALLVIIPFIISKHYSKQGLRDIYMVFVSLLILLTFSSPQYRFYVYFTLFFGLLLAAVWFTKEKIILVLIGMSLLGCTVVLFIPLTFGSITNNQMLSKNNTFTTESLIFPKPNSKNNLTYTRENKGNLDYYAPQKTTIFWITGNGHLPTVNKEQLDYFETYFHVIPQFRGQTLSQGFRAQKVNSHD